jgi:hypothetical protein
MIALAFLLHGIVWSGTPFLLIFVSGVTAILFLSLPEHRDKLPLLLIAIGPLINYVAFPNASYIYNIEVVLLTFFPLWFFSYRKSEHSFCLTRTDMLYMGFLSLVMLSTSVHLFSGDDPIRQFRLVRGFMIGFFLFWFLRSLGERLSSLLPFFFKTTLLAFAVVVALAITEYTIKVTNGITWVTEPRSVFDGPESLAIYLVAMLPLAVGGFPPWFNSRFLTLSSVFMAALGLLALILTHSRAGLFAVIVYCIGRMPSGESNKTRLAGALLILVLVASMFWIMMFKSGLILFEGLPSVTLLVEKIFSSRINPWTQGIMAILRSPIWGNGAYENVYNVFLQLGAQFGAVTVLVFLIFIVKSWLWARPRDVLRRTSEPLSSSIFWSLTTFLLISQGESTLGNQLGYLGWCIIHISGCTYARQEIVK